MLKKIENLAEKSINWVGSISSIIIHTILFILTFILPFFGINFDRVLLILTTIVSLEAIYLSIFIQFTVNKNAEKLNEHVTNTNIHIKKADEHIENSIIHMKEVKEHLKKQNEKNNII